MPNNIFTAVYAFMDLCLQCAPIVVSYLTILFYPQQRRGNSNRGYSNNVRGQSSEDNLSGIMCVSFLMLLFCGYSSFK